MTNSLVLASVVSLFLRFRRARGDARRQMLWVVVAAVPIPALLTAAFVAASTDNDVLLSVATASLIVVVPIGAALR